MERIYFFSLSFHLLSNFNFSLLKLISFQVDFSFGFQLNSSLKNDMFSLFALDLCIDLFMCASSSSNICCSVRLICSGVPKLRTHKERRTLLALRLRYIRCPNVRVAVECRSRIRTHSVSHKLPSREQYL